MRTDGGHLETLVRIGYFARAILYIALGLIALTSIGRVGQGTDGIFRTVRDVPGGTLLLWILVIGLAAYGLFRLASPLFDVEHNGSDAKGWGKRIGHAGSAIGHFALAWSAWRLATGSGSGGGNSASAAASGVMSLEFGGILIGLLGLAFFAAAAAQAKKGITASFMHRISGDAPGATKWLGRIGYLTRAVVFTVIGWSLVQAGFLSRGAGNVKTLAEAVASLADNSAVFTIVAVGLLVFGLFSLVLARYRIIPDLDPRGRIPAFRQKVA